MMKRLAMRFRFRAISGIAIPFVVAGLSGDAYCAPSGEVTVTRTGGRFALHAVNAPVDEIARKLSTATGVEILVDPKLQERTLPISLASRPADRIIWSLARRLDARAEIIYLFRRRAESGSESPWAYASDTVSLPAPLKLRLEDALQELGIRARVESGLDRDVRVFSPGIPLYRVLDNLASQVGAKWSVEVRIEGRTATDDGAESVERMQRHFSELARFSSLERQEEIEADLQSALASPENLKALERLASDIRNLGTHYDRVPGEHRGLLAPKFGAITRDYAAVVRRRGEAERSRLAPLISAIRHAEAKLAGSR